MKEELSNKTSIPDEWDDKQCPYADRVVGS
jgi:hypothetical protein